MFVYQTHFTKNSLSSSLYPLVQYVQVWGFPLGLIAGYLCCQFCAPFFQACFQLDTLPSSQLRPCHYVLTRGMGTEVIHTTNCLKGSFTWGFSLSFLQTEHRTVAQGMVAHPVLPAKVSLSQHLACRDTPPRKDHSGHCPFSVIHWGAVCQSRRLEMA